MIWYSIAFFWRAFILFVCLFICNILLRVRFFIFFSKNRILTFIPYFITNFVTRHDGSCSESDFSLYLIILYFCMKKIFLFYFARKLIKRRDFRVNKKKIERKRNTKCWQNSFFFSFCVRFLFASKSVCFVGHKRARAREIL